MQQESQRNVGAQGLRIERVGPEHAMLGHAVGAGAHMTGEARDARQSLGHVNGQVDHVGRRGHQVESAAGRRLEPRRAHRAARAMRIVNSPRAASGREDGRGASAAAGG